MSEFLFSLWCFWFLLWKFRIKMIYWAFLFVLFQSRSELSSPSPELGKLKRRPAKCTKCSNETINGSQCCLPSRGLAELTSNSCATPPSTRRRIFLPKNLRNPFSIKRHIATVHDNSTLSGKCHLMPSIRLFI